MKPIETYLNRITEGYYRVVDGQLYRNGKKLGTIGKNGYIEYRSSNKRVYAHRLMYAYYNGLDNLDSKLSINHIDGNKLNNKKENLEQISLSENSKHQWKIGLAKKGSECTYSTLNEKQVNEIRKLLLEGYSQYIVAEFYNVSRSTILNINNGSNWKHVAYEEIEIQNYPKTKSRKRTLSGS
jgi:hypothetical protein